MDGISVRIEAKEQLRSIFEDHFVTEQEWIDHRYKKIYTYKALDWRAYNITAARAHQLLWENRTAFLDLSYMEFS